MKSLILFIAILTAGLSFAQVQPFAVVNETGCCPLKTTVILNAEQVHNLHAENVQAIVPPLMQKPDGTYYAPGIHLLAPVVMRVYSDSPQPFTYQSGAQIIIYNDGSPGMNLVTTFGDPSVTFNGASSGTFYHSYIIDTQSPQTAALFIESVTAMGGSAPITGGGANARIEFDFIYEYITY